METSVIKNIEDYNHARKYGFHPFIDQDYEMDIKVRYELQKEIFKTSKSLRMCDVKFYKYCWSVLDHYCEETGWYLKQYSSVYISHILSRGAYPEMRWDIRNINILSFESHQLWEFGTLETKKKMKIWFQNQEKSIFLKEEYLGLK